MVLWWGRGCWFWFCGYRLLVFVFCWFSGFLLWFLVVGWVCSVIVWMWRLYWCLLVVNNVLCVKVVLGLGFLVGWCCFWCWCFDRRILLGSWVGLRSLIGGGIFVYGFFGVRVLLMRWMMDWYICCCCCLICWWILCYSIWWWRWIGLMGIGWIVIWVCWIFGLIFWMVCCCCGVWERLWDWSRGFLCYGWCGSCCWCWWIWMVGWVWVWCYLDRIWVGVDCCFCCDCVWCWFWIVLWVSMLVFIGVCCEWGSFCLRGCVGWWGVVCWIWLVDWLCCGSICFVCCRGWWCGNWVCW